MEKCPECGKDMDISQLTCEYCGWHDACKLEGKDIEESD